MNGTVAAISIHNENIIDVETMSWFCKPCQQTDKCHLRKVLVFCIRNKDLCAANYEGCAPMMVVVGTERIVERSIKKGLSNSENTYCPDMVEKFECVGHYQKRFKDGRP